MSTNVNTMSTTNYYTVWRTWWEGAVNTPWDFYPLKRGDQLKPRAGKEQLTPPSSAQIAAAFEAENSRFLNEVEENFVEDIWLAAFVPAIDQNSAAKQIIKLFPDAEIQRCVAVDPATQQSILQLFSGAASKP